MGGVFRPSKHRKGKWGEHGVSTSFFKINEVPHFLWENGGKMMDFIPKLYWDLTSFDGYVEDLSSHFLHCVIHL